MKFLYFYELSYGVATGLAKLPICLFRLRFTVEQTHIGIIYGVIGVIIFFSVFLIVFTVLQCKPVSAYWNNNATGDNVDTVKVTYAHSAIVAATD